MFRVCNSWTLITDYSLVIVMEFLQPLKIRQRMADQGKSEERER